MMRAQRTPGEQTAQNFETLVLSPPCRPKDQRVLGTQHLHCGWGECEHIVDRAGMRFFERQRQQGVGAADVGKGNALVCRTGKQVRRLQGAGNAGTSIARLRLCNIAHRFLRSDVHGVGV